MEEDSEGSKLGCLVIWRGKALIITQCRMLPSGHGKSSGIIAQFSTGMVDSWSVCNIVYANGATVCEGYVKWKRKYGKSSFKCIPRICFPPNIPQILELSGMWRLIPKLEPQTLTQTFNFRNIKEELVSSGSVRVHTDIWSWRHMDWQVTRCLDRFGGCHPASSVFQWIFQWLTAGHAVHYWTICVYSCS